MKLNKFTYLLVPGIALTLAVSGCHKRPGWITPIPGQKPGMVGDAGNAPALNNGPGTESQPVTGTEGIPANPAGSHEGWKENADALKAQTVYFAFDSANITSAEKPKVAAVADYLKANPQAAVRVEGNCDERGTEEYNRSLGERRAVAVREELVRLGVDPGRVDTVTYGEDKPAVQGHDEAAYKMNRRDDFIVLTPP